uniref:Uncharacterized protein n=1 Tax=Arabidopsis thaliana TaxID=3702 RepID=Q56W57_ARATH|nr:hypothetical protein [Arabidopsis thaliana]
MADFRQPLFTTLEPLQSTDKLDRISKAQSVGSFFKLVESRVKLVDRRHVVFSYQLSDFVCEGFPTGEG